MRNLQITFHMFVQLHDSSLITASITVIRSGKNRHYFFLMRPIISLEAVWNEKLLEEGISKHSTYFHHQLMCTCNHREMVIINKLLRNILAECVASTTR
jgi:hypothetical protein